jgi:hypothetical protein
LEKETQNRAATNGHAATENGNAGRHENIILNAIKGPTNGKVEVVQE